MKPVKPPAELPDPYDPYGAGAWRFPDPARQAALGAPVGCSVTDDRGRPCRRPAVGTVRVEDGDRRVLTDPPEQPVCAECKGPLLDLIARARWRGAFTPYTVYRETP
jgi:hypothetical protein